jgi:phage/plasmid primase-like uncharacterized protein
MANIPSHPNGKKNIEEILKGSHSGLVYKIDGDPRLAFMAELKSAGLQLKGPLILDKLVRLKDSQDKGTSKSGWYVFNLLEDKYRSGSQFGVGSYGSWHNNPPSTNWCSKFEQGMDDSERQAYHDQLAETRAKQEREQAERHESAAKEAQVIWNDATTKGVATHDYVTKKKIKPYDVRISPKGEVLVPVYNQWDQIVSLQKITTKGKYFLSGGKTKGGFYLLGNDESSDTVILTEGWATACTLYEASEYPVYVAFSASNLLNVASLVRSRHPKANIIIAGDNDQFTTNPPNPGKKAAMAAAKLCDGNVILPEFADDELDSKPTDFNDLHCLRNLNAVKSYLPKKEKTTKNKPPKQEESSQPWDFVYEKPNVITDTVRWITKSAQKPQPELALMNTIAALGAVFGRRYRTNSNLRSNVYFVGIAGTGSGKDHSRKCIKMMLEKAGMEYFIGPDDFVSGPGILAGLKNNPSQLMNFDEMGEKYQIANQQNAGGYIKQGVVTITRLFSDAASTHDGGNYADENKRKKVKIFQPNLCIFGTSTLESYAATLKSSFVENGMLNRFMAMKVTHDIPKRNRGAVQPDDIPENLLEAWRLLRPLNYSAEPYENIITVPFTDEAQEYYDDLGDQEDDKVREFIKAGRGAMWNRYREHITKLSLIFAIAEKPFEPLIDKEHMESAERLVISSMNFTMSLMNEYMYDSEFERQTKKAMRIIKKRKGVARSELLRIMSMKSKELDDVMTALIQMNKVEAVEGDSPKSGFKPVVYYPYGKAL